jgi:hypothetical protein
MGTPNYYPGQFNPQYGTPGPNTYGGGGIGGPLPGNYSQDQASVSNINQLAGNVANMNKEDLSYADQALKTAFDPNQQIFDQQQQQLTDSTRAALAARGLSSSPYGAGVESNTDANFRNAWQTAQVGRESVGAQTAEGLQAQYQSSQVAAAGMYAQSAGINQGDIALQLQGYGLQGQQLLAAQQMMLQYLESSRAMSDKEAAWNRWGGDTNGFTSGAAGIVGNPGMQSPF